MKFKKSIIFIVTIVVLLSMALSACKFDRLPTGDTTPSGGIPSGDTAQSGDATQNGGTTSSGDTKPSEDIIPSYIQQLNYAESIERINNPDQGFYQAVYVTATENGLSYAQYVITETTQLYHLRIDISAFSGAVNGSVDKELTQSMLDSFEELLAYLRGRDKNAIVRFAYDPSFAGNANKEPSLQTMLTHIRQFSAIINDYENTVTAVEAGLIGPWGEMHTSAIANATNITPIIDEYLNNINNLPVLVRTPKMIYDYLGITVADIDGYAIEKTDKAYRLGIYNDGYLGSDTDLGTYTNREKEVEFLSTQTGHLPYGGEVVVPTSNFHNIDVCVPEMFKLNLSYLNMAWNDTVINKWKNTTYTADCGDDELYYGASAYTYIENHFGYRFVLTQSTFKYAQTLDKLQIQLNFKNTGFGNLNRSKLAKIILVDENGEVAYEYDASEFTGADIYTCTLDNLNLQSGTYDVYLRVYGAEYNDLPQYCIQFANDELWDATLKANKIGNISK